MFLFRLRFNIDCGRVWKDFWKGFGKGFGRGLEALGVSGAIFGRRFMMLQLGVPSERALGPSQGRF